MRVSNKILDSINESIEDAENSDYKEFNNQISILIEDENEAINSYENAMDVLSKIMTDYQYNEIVRVLSHIIKEEKEHVEELKKLRDDLDITSWK